MITVTVPTIADSGQRREFETGAVRDIQTGKGRPTLMPLHVVATLLGERMNHDLVLQQIAYFSDTESTEYLYQALRLFAEQAYDGSVETMILEAAIHYEMGCAKYGEDNWKKGIPVNCYLDSAIRHYLKYRRGDNDEPHHRAFTWNVMSCIWEVDYHD